MELNLRAIRVVQTRLDYLLGDVSTAEAVKLLTLEMSEVDDSLNLVSALAAVGAVSVIMMAQTQSLDTNAIICQIRQLMAPVS
jgi:hypothetical protein